MHSRFPEIERQVAQELEQLSETEERINAHVELITRPLTQRQQQIDQLLRPIALNAGHYISACLAKGNGRETGSFWKAFQALFQEPKPGTPTADELRNQWWAPGYVQFEGHMVRLYVAAYGGDSPIKSPRIHFGAEEHNNYLSFVQGRAEIVTPQRDAAPLRRDPTVYEASIYRSWYLTNHQRQTPNLPILGR